MRNSSAVHEHIASSRDTRWIPAKKVRDTGSNTFKRRIREVIENRLRKTSLNSDNGFDLANI